MILAILINDRCLKCKIRKPRGKGFCILHKTIFNYKTARAPTNLHHPGQKSRFLLLKLLPVKIWSMWIWRRQIRWTSWGWAVKYFQTNNVNVTDLFCLILVCVQVNSGGCPRGVMVKAMDCGIVVREFVHQLRYYVHFRVNTLGKDMNPLILPAMG